MSSSRDDTQEKAFLRWTNIMLSKHETTPRQLENLVEEMSDGTALGLLAEVILSTKLRLVSKPKNDLQRTQNITMALDAFESSGCQLINIHSSSIGRGDKKTILGLLFQLCLKYQVSGSDGNSNVAQLKKQLIDFINEKISTLNPEEVLGIRLATGVYSEEPLECKNLEGSLQDGTILAALVAVFHAPRVLELIDEINQRAESIGGEYGPDFQKNSLSLTTAAMQLADEMLDIPQLIDPSDMVVTADADANLAYLSYFKNLSDEGRTSGRYLDRPKLAPALSISNPQPVDIPSLPDNVITLETFDPTVDYGNDVVMYL